MAVNVDNVYQKVLVLANKEQRGYITPQEFNLLASQAQLDIFENYFYELDMALRMAPNDTVYADKVDSIRERINVHEAFRQTVSMSAGGVGTLPTSYKLGKLSYNDSGTYREIQLIPKNELNHYLNNKLLSPSVKRPIYIKTSENAIQVYPTSIASGVTCNIIQKPADPNWAYVVVNKKALFNSTAKVDFDLHEAEENNLVMRIVELAGVTIKNPDVSGYALQDRAAKDNKKNS